MPRRAKGAYLYLRPPHTDKRSGKIEPVSWIIRDGQAVRRTGCAAEDVAGTERAFNVYLAEKHTIDGTPEHRAADIAIADVLNIYAQDVVAKHARPKESVVRLLLLDTFGASARCRRSPAGLPRLCRTADIAGGHALEDLRSAVNHHRKEGYCTEVVSIVLPERGELATDRLGRRIVTTPAMIAEWRRRCRVSAEAPLPQEASQRIGPLLHPGRQAADRNRLRR